jgi:putative peptidoglycan binding protein
MQERPAVLFLVLAALILAATPAAAETAPSAADVAFAAQKSTFLALPEATRKAVQDALVWLGFYNGVNDGDFGKRTRDSIVAYQLSQQAGGDGVLSAAQLQALLAAADKMRATVGFEAIDDPKTGARIGAPTMLTAKRGGVKLEFASSADPDLPALYGRLSAETSIRKVAYKAIKPGLFLVVSGQDGGTKFYSRFEKSEAASPPVRGFTFAYPAAQAKQLDRVAIAVANSFEAFPLRPQTTSGPSGTPAPAARAPAPTSAPAATALIIGPGQALTALMPAECPGASVGGKPVRFERTDAASGLAILSGDFGGKGGSVRLGSLAPDLVVLSAGNEGVSASAASLAVDDAKPVVFVALEKSASGGPAFDQEGALAALVAPIGDEPKRINDVALAAPHAIIGAEAIGAFLAGGAIEARPTPPARLTAGLIAAQERDALLVVSCVR